MLSHRQRRGGPHRVDVERAMIPTDAARHQAGPHRAHEQQVDVVPRARRVACVERVADRLRPQHRHRRGQVRVHAAHPRRQRPIVGNVRVHHLRARVHARIGAPCGRRHDLAPRDRRQRVLQRVLHAASRRLRLEAAEAAAVVFEAEGEAHW
jgi:hypothetical protein